MIRHWCFAALGTAALSTALAACGPDEAAAQASPAPASDPTAPEALPDIEGEAQKAADAIDESNADEELEKLKSELESP
jgi:hypothetical protein